MKSAFFGTKTEEQIVYLNSYFLIFYFYLRRSRNEEQYYTYCIFGVPMILLEGVGQMVEARIELANNTTVF